MEALNVETLVRLAEQIELLHRLEALLAPHQRPSETLRLFHVEHFPEDMTLRRKDEYGDDER